MAGTNKMFEESSACARVADNVDGLYWCFGLMVRLSPARGT